jgi:hypothetical protein
MQPHVVYVAVPAAGEAPAGSRRYRAVAAALLIAAAVITLVSARCVTKNTLSTCMPADAQRRARRAQHVEHAR